MMNGELAQCLALAIRGDAWLAGGRGDPPDLIDTSSFRFVRRVEFKLDRGPTVPLIFASTTAEWFAGLRSRGVTRLRAASLAGIQLAGVPRFQGAGFAGTGQWAIVAEIDAASGELWHGGGTVNRRPGDPTPEDKRIWDLHYEGSAINALPAEHRDVAAAQARLVTAIDEARHLATLEGWTQWADWLGKARELAASDDPLAHDDADLIPPSAPLDIRRLFASAAGAWVFGGMGWWNDMGASPGREQDYDRISTELYDAVVEGLITAANAVGGETG